MDPLPVELKAANDDTWRHIHRVQYYLLRAAKLLMDRAHVHDQSKLEPPEVALFAEATPRLAGVTYDSPEYKAFLVQLEPALKHHYAANRHHPQHWARGIEDMNLVDIVEMFCDWMASSERHADGNIRTSIERNGPRFDIPPKLCRIFENTVSALRD